VLYNPGDSSAIQDPAGNIYFSGRRQFGVSSWPTGNPSLGGGVAWQASTTTAPSNSSESESIPDGGSIGRMRSPYVSGTSDPRGGGSARAMVPKSPKDMYPLFCNFVCSVHLLEPKAVLTSKHIQEVPVCLGASLTC